MITVPTGYSNANIQLALLSALRMLLAPVVSVALLVVLTQLLDVGFTRAYVALAIIAALLCLIFIGRDKSTNAIFTSGLTITGRIGFAWLAVVGTLLLIGYATKTSDIFSRRALFAWFLVTPAMLVAAYMVVRHFVRMILMSSSNARRAVIVGANEMSLDLARTVMHRPELGLKLRCVFDEIDRLDASTHCDCEFRASLQGIREFVNTHHIDVVFIALPIQDSRTLEVLADLRDTTCSVYMVPDISVVDLIQARTDDIHGVPVIALCESPLQGLHGVIKRATDIVITTILLVIVAPLMIGIAAAIRFTSPGPVIFRQYRYGLDGERIVVYKFRSMTVTENGPEIAQARRDDPRVTRVGRFLRRTSLDELPQLINVLEGRMSLVGPRPHAVAHNEQYRKLISGYMVRHKVAPGITGLAQVNGCRGETATVEEMRRRVEYDIEYLRQWCWLLDIKILLKTCRVVFRDQRAY